MPKSESSNPFSKFAAHSGGGGGGGAGGWLSAKRVGRDDDAIARDRRIAFDARRAARNSRGGGGKKKKQKNGGGATPSKSNRRRKGGMRLGDSTSEEEIEFDDEDESGESEASFQDEESVEEVDTDDFIVDSDEDEEAVAVGSSSDDEEGPRRSSPQRKPSSRRHRQRRGLEEMRRAVAAKKRKKAGARSPQLGGASGRRVGRPIAAPPGRKRFRGQAVFGALGSDDSSDDSQSSIDGAEVRGETTASLSGRIPRKGEKRMGGTVRASLGGVGDSSSAGTTPPSPSSPTSSDDGKRSRYLSSAAAERRSRSSDGDRRHRGGGHHRGEGPPARGGRGGGEDGRPSHDRRSRHRRTSPASSPSSTAAADTTTIDLCSSPPPSSSSSSPEADDEDVDVVAVKGGGIDPADGVGRAGRERGKTKTTTKTRRRAILLDDDDSSGDDEHSSDDHLLEYDAFAPSEKPTAKKRRMDDERKEERGGGAIPSSSTLHDCGGGGGGTMIMMPRSPSDEEEMVRRAIRESSSASAGGVAATAEEMMRTSEEEDDDDFRLALAMAKEASMTSSSSWGTDPFAESPLVAMPGGGAGRGVSSKKGVAGRKEDGTTKRRRIRKQVNGTGVDVPTRRGGGGGRVEKKDGDGATISSPVMVDEDEEPEVLSAKNDGDADDGFDDGVDGGDDAGDGNDASYVDSDEEEANDVLETANALSARVLDVMTSWASCPSSCGDDGGDANEGGETPPTVSGTMIVDGALAVSAMGGGGGGGGGDVATAARGRGTDGGGSSSWISAEEMSRALSPSKITLADYQLVGVNWMALMHSLTCDLVDTKKRGRRNDGEGGGGRTRREKNGGDDSDDDDGDYEVEVKRGGGRRRGRGGRRKKSLEKKRGGGHGGWSNVNGVLADEMGLGKTVQTIAFLAWLKYRDRRDGGGRGVVAADDDVVTVAEEKKGDDDVNDDLVDRGGDGPAPRRHLPHIIVVPASVLSNWEREFRVVCPSMRVVRYHGTMKERDEMKAELTRFDADPFDVLLTTYSYFSTERGDDRNFLRNNFDFDYMVVDEAHCLKNPRGARYRNLDMMNTEHRLLLTGTPVQNSPQELMSLLCFLMPLFAPRTSGASFDEKKENDGGARMLEHFITIENKKKKPSKDDYSMGNSENEAQVYRKLKLLLAPFILRRRKCDVSLHSLPPKIRKVEFVPFDKASRQVYESLLSSHIKSRRGTDMVGSESTMKNLFTALRKAANHPLLLRTRHTNEEAMGELSCHFYRFGFFGRDSTCTKDMVRRELGGFSDFDVHCASLELIEEYPHLQKSLEKYTLAAEDLFCSPKFVRLRTMLPQLIKEGHRILIFSQWTKCLDLLGCLLEHLGVQFLRFDGQINVKERQALIDTFNNDASIPIFLLSTRAGGMGINLTSADTCILHDLDFNPFNDLQAEDRVHRMGQTKQVTVYKMVTEGTVDADIYAMQERKAKMNAAIFEQENDATVKAQAKDNEKNEMSTIVQTAVERFMLSPTGKTKDL